MENKCHRIALVLIASTSENTTEHFVDGHQRCLSISRQIGTTLLYTLIATASFNLIFQVFIISL